jgi:tight adherence protein C
MIPLPLLLLIALTIGAIGLAVWSMLAGNKASMQARLDSITTEVRPSAQVSVIADDVPKGLWARLVIALGSARANKQRADKRASLRTTMRHAGFRGANAIAFMFGLRVMVMIALPALFAPLAYTYAGGQLALIVLLLALPVALGYVLPTVVVNSLARKRIARIDAALPDVLDLLVVCMEAGLGLNAAITRVAEERAGTGDTLGEEMAQLSSELRAGVPRKDALQNLADRAGGEDLRAVVAQLVHTERLGGNVGPALRAQSDSVRTAHKLRAEEIANRMPIKMLLPTVLFMPALFIVIIAPVVLRVMAVLADKPAP